MPRFTISDIILDISEHLLTPDIRRALSKGHYEGQEARSIKTNVKADDKVLEIGAGIGFTTVTAAKIVGGKNVVAIEANPDLQPEILNNLALNEVGGVTLLNQIILPEAGKTEACLYVPDGFWGATIDGMKIPTAREIVMPAIGFDELLSRYPATVLICDVEGAEADFFCNPVPEALRLILLELHPRRYSLKVIKTIFDRLSVLGFGYVPFSSKGPVICFKRVGKPAPATGEKR